MTQRRFLRSRALSLLGDKFLTVKRAIAVLVMTAALLVTAASCARMDAGPSRTSPSQERASVERVVDGDTIIVRADGARVRVRLIGVDTPEVVKPGAPVQCYGPESSAETHRLLDGQDVVLVYDTERYDAYRRRLAYVMRAHDGLFVNEFLIAGGFATALEIEPNVARAGVLRVAEQRARRARLGLWGACAH